MGIKGVIFDLDGTLVHTIEDIGDAANVMLARHGMPQHTTADYLRWIGNGAARLIELALGPDADKTLFDYQLTEFKEIYGDNLHNKSRLYDGIAMVLDEYTAAGVKLSILSNKPHYLTRQVVDYYLSDWEFTPVFGQRESVPRKPDPAAAFEIADTLGLTSEYILFVGDSRGDLTTAEAAGMVPVGVTWGYGRLAGIPRNGQVIIDQPHELLSLIK